MRITLVRMGSVLRASLKSGTILQKRNFGVTIFVSYDTVKFFNIKFSCNL